MVLYLVCLYRPTVLALGKPIEKMSGSQENEVF
jgi:hypothetical protein